MANLFERIKYFTTGIYFSKYKWTFIKIVLITFIVTTACKKTNDFLSDIEFANPNPPDGAVNVDIKNVRVYFDSIYSSYDLPIKIIITKVFFDTINPPVQSQRLQNGLILLESLKPNTIYYWNYLVENMAGEFYSSIFSFTTTSFEGQWKYDTTLNNTIDSLDNLITNISEFIIAGNSANIKIGERFIPSTFKYDLNNSKVSFIEYQSGLVHSYYLQSLAFRQECDKIVLVLSGNNCLTRYSRL